MKSLIFFKNKKPFINIPINGSLNLSIKAISCLPSYTFKRKLYKIYLYFQILSWHFFLKYFFSDNTNDKASLLNEWFISFLKNNKSLNLYPVFIWSLVEGRNRYYIHLLNSKGEKVYFVKITTNKNDYFLLKNEYEKLLNLQNNRANCDIYITPKVISFEENSKYCSLTVESLDKNFILYHPEEYTLPNNLQEKIQGEKSTIKLKDIISLPFWQYSLRYKEEFQSLYDFIGNSDEDSFVGLSFVHGDFGSENIFINQQGLFCVIDWERSTDKAPHHTDIVAYWLGKNHRNLKENPNKACEKFFNDFKTKKKLDIALALIFLMSVIFDLAFIVALKWK